MKKILIVAWMLSVFSVALLSWVSASNLLAAKAQGAPVANGDVNGNGTIKVTDAVYFLRWLFQNGGSPVACAQEPGGLTPEQKAILDHFSLMELPNGEGGTVPTIRLSGANLQIVNGVGETGTSNGLGNLIVGYQETRRNPVPPGGEEVDNHRTGSHNLVVGSRHNYTSFGGAVLGFSNSIAGEYSTVTGGRENTARGGSSSITGGLGSRALNVASTVTGGLDNTASGLTSTVSGGQRNTAEGLVSSISGGRNNSATALGSSVSGGNGNVASSEDGHLP